jgi:hypothetical protein
MSNHSISSSVDQSSLLEDYERVSTQDTGEVMYNASNDDCAYNALLPLAPAIPPWGAGAWYNPYSSTMMYFSEISSYFSGKFLSWLAISNFFVSGGSIPLSLL